MAKKSLPGGIIVEYPDDLSLRESVGEQADGLRAIPKQFSDDEEILKMVAESPEFTTVATLEIIGGVKKDRLAAMEDEKTEEEVKVHLPLEDDEAAVLLSESDGVIRWEYPESIEEVADDQRVDGLGAAPAKPRRVAVFKSRYRPVVDTDEQPEKLGFVGDFLLKPIKKLVLRFTARKTAQALSSYLERDVAEGPIVFTKDGAKTVTWSPVSSFSEAWTTEGAKTVLLFVHGTFSSTVGSFGGLATTQAGIDFLSRALDHYDAVIGFDHKTLTKTVGQNAADILAALDTLPKAEVTCDAVAFSRGGLVLRYLTEVLLPARAHQYHFRSAIFVGCTNGGTKLAHPEHWKELVDLYTNLVSGAGRLVSFAGGPATKLASKIVTEGIRGVLSFVRYLATEATSGEAVPGLASMDPQGTDVKRINRKPQELPIPVKMDYHIIETNFDHHLFGDEALAKVGLKKRLFLEVADNFIDQLFQNAENDLVVDCASMSYVDPGATEACIKGRHKIEKGNGVYHTVYFNNELVAEKITSWLL